MIGAIIGDIVGSTREFNNTFDYDFELFEKGSEYTDDTICTIAIADAILKKRPYKDSLIEWCKRYPLPKGGYGASFLGWIYSKKHAPYDSFGNGAAMRISPVGWAFKGSDIGKNVEKATACSHSHEEGIKGAMATAIAIALLKDGGKKEAADVVCKQYYGEDYESRLPHVGAWNETCQGCVPLALHLFKLSSSFEDAIRMSISYGGDSDTLGAIVGSIAGAYYPIPEHLRKAAIKFLPEEMKRVLTEFEAKYGTERTYQRMPLF